MKDVRILHIVPALFDSRLGVLGGAERYAFELARQMAEEVPTRLVTFGDRNLQETVGRLEIRVIGNARYVRGQRQNPFSSALFRELAEASVVHCYQQHILTSSLAALACRLRGRRVFVSDLGGGGWDISAYVSTDRWYHGHLHISEYSRKTFGHAGKPWAQVILGGVDAQKFSPDGSGPRDGSVVFVGRLLPHKGVNDLVNAVPADMRLKIIGQPHDPRFCQDLHALSAGKQVTFHDDFTDSDLVSAYRKALCVVLPSVYQTMYGQRSEVPELLGQTLLEGMACGAPAICTDVASMPEVVEDGVTGFVVPASDPLVLGEKLRWLRDHPDRAREMGQAARRRVLEKFTWPAVVHRCLEIYAQSKASKSLAKGQASMYEPRGARNEL
jgi:glycosyltransferase involved in cell wall biosynthesis